MAEISKTIGFVGLGRMGRQMAARLAAHGFSLQVWNRTRDRAAEVPGATAVDSPRDAASGAAIVVSSLADDVAVRDVILGEAGVLRGLGPDSVHVSTSTISIRLARALVSAHADARRAFVAAPVLGRPDAAGRGELWILTGGEAEALARAKPALDVLGQGQIHLGDPAQALLGKIVVNFMIAGTLELLGEAITLAEKGGIAPGDLVDMLAGTVFGSPIVKGYGPRMAARAFQPAGFTVPLGLKDVELALEAGHDLRAPLPVAAIARDHLLAALARGRDDWDWSALVTSIRQSAGLGD